MCPPELFTFDIFGTVLDWRRGTEENCRKAGFPLRLGDFDAIVDVQGREEQKGFRPYSEIVALSLQEVLGMEASPARAIGAAAGRWPLFADSPAALKRLLAIAPCMAMSNSDTIHGEDVQKGLGFPLTDWLCAQDTRLYKPSPDFWRAAAKRRAIPFGQGWWHVSAYADYDLDVAKDFGLTCVFIDRPHSRRGPADLSFVDLAALADYCEIRFPRG